MIEVAVALFIFALVASSTLLIFSQLFGGQRALDSNVDGALALETLSEEFRKHAQDKWPADVSAEGDLSGRFIYRVEDLGLQVDPLDDTRTIELKRLRVTVTYESQTMTGGSQTREETSSFLVGR